MKSSVIVSLFVLYCSVNFSFGQAFDVQGHRGCRGLMPENSIPGFLKAMDLGVTILEMEDD